MTAYFDLSPDAPWRERFRAQQVIGSSIAPGATERGIVVTNKSGIYQLYRWDVASNTLEQLTDRPEGVLAHVFAPDGRHVYYLDDEQGNEIGHYVRIPYEGGVVEDVTPDLPHFSPAGLTISRSNNSFQFTAGTRAGFHTYFVALDAKGQPSEPRLLAENKALVFTGPLSYGGEIAVLASTERSGRPEFSLLAFDTASGEQIAELWDGEETSVVPARFSPLPGDTRLLATSTRSGIERLLIWDPRRNEREDLLLESAPGAARPLDWSPDGRRILFRTFERAQQRLFIYDIDEGTLTELADLSGTVSEAYFTPSGELYAHVQDAAHPTRLVALDKTTGAIERTVLQATEIPAGRPWRSVEFASGDGTPIQAWLATPEGEGPFPTIIHMIGGPGGVQADTYSPASQAWLDQNFAWLTLNYRGCTTFGHEFEAQIFGNPGYWEVEDIVAARNWLVSSRVADSETIFLHGWSYGGYLTLMALGKYPDLWAGGLAGIAIADWRVQYEDSAELLRGFQETLLGGSPDDVPEQYAASSPITYVENVKAPVLIVQGRSDTRTPARPVEQYEQRLRELGGDVTVHWFDTGHVGGFADANLAIEHQERFMEFVQRILSLG